MARTLGTYSLSANIEPNVSAPLDARDRVPTMADLTASGAFPYRYIGMETYVVAVNKKYRLIGSDPTVLSNWEEVGSGGSGGASSLDELSDVDISTPTNGQVLKYDSTSEEWVNADASGGGHTIKDGTGTSMTQRSGLKFSGSMSVTDDSSGDNTVVSMPPLMDSADMSEIINPLPTPSSTPDLDDLGDVDILNPTNGQVLKYDSTNQEWVNANDAGGTEVTPNPSDTATATLEKIQIDSTIYGIPEGTDVEANPSGTATSDLTKLKVGTEIYGIPNPTVPEDLEDLDNVNISTPTNGQVLKYDSTNQEWVNANESGGSGGGHTIKDGTGTSMTQRSGLKFSGSMSVTDDSSGDNTVVSMPPLMDSADMSEIVTPLPTPASSPDLDDLGNVDISSPTDGQVLKYDSTNDEWVNANESGGGGTTVVANPSGTATADLEKLQVGNDIYGIPEGTEVVANPVTAATSVLSKLKIDDTIYQLVGGSGDLSRVVALDETARTTTNTDFELADSIFNYDFLVVQIYYNAGNGNSWAGSTIIFTETLKTTDHTGYDGTVWIDGGNNDRAMCIKFTDSTHYRITNAGSSNTLKGVYGLKITTEEYTKDTLFESDTNVDTFNLSHPYTNYDAIVVTVKYSGSTAGTYYMTGYFNTDQLVTGSRYGVASDDWYTYFEVTSTTSFTRDSYRYSFLCKIDGIKYGAYGASGGADVEANPSGTATVDLAKLKVDDTIYAIPEGTDVEANPTGTATADLETIRIGETIYDIPGSGGGSGSGSGIVTLDHENRTALNTSFELAHPVTDFDLILIQIYWTGNLNNYTGSRVFNVDDLFGGAHPSTVWVDGGNNDRAVNITFVDSTHYMITSSKGSDGIYGVYGINISGSGGKSNKEIVQQTNTAIADGTVITLNLTKKYNDPYVFAANALPKSSWGGLVVVNEDYGVTYDSTNNTLSFKTYTNKAQNYDIDWVVFDLSAVSGGGGEGTEVEANPQETPTDTLETIKIGDTVYDIASSGGNAYSETVIYNGTSFSETMNLDDDIDKYDYLLVEAGYLVNQYSIEMRSAEIFSVDTLMDNIGSTYQYGISNDTYYCYFYVDNKNTLKNGTYRNTMFIHTIKGIKIRGGNGTEVEANPSESATDTLETIKIGDTVYDIASSGGSGKAYSIEDLYTGTSRVNSMTMSKSIANFDMIEIECSFVYNGNTFQFSNVYSTERILNNDSGVYSEIEIGYANPRCMGLNFSDNTTLVVIESGDSGNYVSKVRGIKFGGSVGGGTTSYTLWETPNGSGTGTFTLSDSIDNYDVLVIYVGKYSEYTSGIKIVDPFFITVNEAKALHDQGLRMAFSGWDNRNNFLDFDGTTMNVSISENSQSVLKVIGVKIARKDEIVYSANEEIVGKWIDGKPIYRSIYTASVTQADTSIDITVPPIDTLVKFDHTYIDPRSSMGFGYYNGNSDRARVFIEGGKLRIIKGGSYPTTPMKVVLIMEYTKTTDT